MTDANKKDDPKTKLVDKEAGRNDTSKKEKKTGKGNEYTNNDECKDNKKNKTDEAGTDGKGGVISQHQRVTRLRKRGKQTLYDRL